MCGIVGKVDSRLSSDEMASQLARMASAIVHRGPDDSGFCCGDGVGIGMRRLSIIDVSGGQQPISNEDSTVHAVCNGEIYNFRELRQELEGRGHRFTTGSDAEVIVHLYEELGETCFARLRGMFGLAIWDENADRVLIARDRLGKKPLFYSQSNGRFAFGSEMKSLLSDDPSLRQPNYRTLGHFFQFAYIPEPETIYAGISRLPAAHYGVWESGRFRQTAYWTLDFDADESVDEQDWIDELDAKLLEATRIRLESEVPLGVFLSGGLDSSAIVAYAHAAGLSPLKTFTIGFDRAEWDESDDAARVARHYETDHHLLRLSETELSSSFGDTLSKIIAHCDEPFGDASAIPTYHVSRLAREHVTVILSGDGGDELFAGYSSYRGALFAQKYRSWLPQSIGRHVLPSLVGGLAKGLPSQLSFKTQRIAKILRDSALPIVEAYRDKTSIWNRSQLRELLTPGLFDNADFVGDQYMPAPLWDILTNTNSNRDLVSRLTEIDIRSYMLDDILVKVDRMSMAHSLEVRSPLLDHEVVELAARMPTRMKIRDGKGKHVLRRALEDKLPPRSLRKGKQGFSVPLRDWFRSELREFVHDTLTSTEYLPSDMFDPRTVSRTLDEHQRGTVDHANRIWLLLTFATWHAQNTAASSIESERPLATATAGILPSEMEAL